jgi:hypothetical protein
VAADSTAPASFSSPSAPAVPPVSERMAFAVLGSMLVLIVALTLLLIQTTWVDPAGATEAPPVAADGGSLVLR